MRKGCIFLTCFVLSVLTACGDGRSSLSSSLRTGNKPAGVNDVLEAGMAGEDSKNTDSEISASTAAPDDVENLQNEYYEDIEIPEPVFEPEISGNSTDGIDVDLTALSSTMVYSEVYNMLLSPEAYIGKTVKMGGVFAYYHDDASDKDYYACIISDATACCSQGIEFILSDDYSYPEDYPEEGEDICVVGVFDTYRENDYTYFTLRNANLI